jgi:hypothetical protein
MDSNFFLLTPVNKTIRKRFGLQEFNTALTSAEPVRSAFAPDHDPTGSAPFAPGPDQSVIHILKKTNPFVMKSVTFKCLNR